MRGFYMELPPPSPDSSGFAAALGGTDGAGLLDDVRGAVGNYYGWEETRTDIPVRAFVSQLGNEDAIFGSEQLMLQRFCEIKEALAPHFFLFATSPIGSILNSDVDWLSRKVSEEYGTPACGVHLSGSDTYDVGVSRTLCAMAEGFSEPNAGPAAGINLIGANCLDWTLADLAKLRQWVENATGEKVNIVFGDRFTYEEIQHLGQARVNWVLSVAGLSCAGLMRRKFGTPYICGAPFGSRTAHRLVAQVTGGDEESCAPKPAIRQERLLIIGEQFAANALRETLEQRFGFSHVAVSSLFTMSKEHMQPQDFHITDELTLAQRATGYEIVIADPIIRRCLNGDTAFISWPQPPVSSKLYADQRPDLLDNLADEWLSLKLSAITR